MLYSEQCGDDLKSLFLSAIYSAKTSIFILIYGLTDPEIIQALNEKYAQGVELRVFYDKGGSKNLSKQLPLNTAFAVKTSGLMHKKVLCIDDHLTFLGSANLTETSLRLHDNLVVAVENISLCHFLKRSLSSKHTLEFNDQSLEVWSLPDKKKLALKKVIEMIDNAKKSIYISMFTFTNTELCQALINAKSRGVKIRVAFDHYSAKGASKGTLENLKSNNIRTFTSSSGKLLHHKWCLIDSKTLILGSTNWTSAAFSKNDDCLLVLSPLDSRQKSMIKKIWRSQKIEKSETINSF